MSGGSMDYLYSKLEYAQFRQDTPERKAFAQHLEKVAKALHDIEWVDSGDYGPGDENEALRACLGWDIEPVAKILIDSNGYCVDVVRKQVPLSAGFHDVYTHPPAADVQELVQALKEIIEHCPNSWAEIRADVALKIWEWR
jgi:hypothetical protein